MEKDIPFPWIYVNFCRLPGQTARVVTRSTSRAASKMSTRLSASTGDEEEQIRCFWPVGITREPNFRPIFFSFSFLPYFPYCATLHVSRTCKLSHPLLGSDKRRKLISTTRLWHGCVKFFYPKINIKRFFEIRFLFIHPIFFSFFFFLSNSENVKGRQIPVTVRARRRFPLATRTNVARDEFHVIAIGRHADGHAESERN